MLNEPARAASGCPRCAALTYRAETAEIRAANLEEIIMDAGLNIAKRLRDRDAEQRLEEQ